MPGGGLAALLSQTDSRITLCWEKTTAFCPLSMIGRISWRRRDTLKKDEKTRKPCQSSQPASKTNPWNESFVRKTNTPSSREHTLNTAFTFRSKRDAKGWVHLELRGPSALVVGRALRIWPGREHDLLSAHEIRDCKFVRVHHTSSDGRLVSYRSTGSMQVRCQPGSNGRKRCEFAKICTAEEATEREGDSYCWVPNQIEKRGW